jgi:hypothetical protein
MCSPTLNTTKQSPDTPQELFCRPPSKVFHIKAFIFTIQVFRMHQTKMPQSGTDKLSVTFLQYFLPAPDL